MAVKTKRSSSSSSVETKARKLKTSKKPKSIGQNINGASSPRSTPYEDLLYEDLKDPNEAAAYLTACLDDRNPNVFLLALKDVAKVYGGIGKLSQKTKLDRKSIYRMLSDSGNPELYSLDAILKALGFKLAIRAEDEAS